ncbi:hypothetical protein [Streptomyces sp. NPDC051921]|uniref:hypothetical protein n=1 Tax=Streptomyces sp. NPDC051921 TaxID=3155806 RepID=UPI003425A3A6
MGENGIALVVAVVGVVGTLGAALLTQSRADRSKQRELRAVAEQQREERRHAESVRRSERREEQARERLELRRGCYIALNTGARQYLTAQVNLAHALRGRGDRAARLKDLEEQRIAFRTTYAEAQMIVPAAVLASAAEVSHWLNGGYGSLKGLAGTGDDTPGEDEFGSFQERVDQAWKLLTRMRGVMRRDLAIDDEEEEQPG